MLSTFDSDRADVLMAFGTGTRSVYPRPRRQSGMKARSKTILIVEDGVAERRLLRTIPDEIRLCANLEIVSNGAEAVEYLKSRTPGSGSFGNGFPDMILVDLNMPVMNGFELIGEIVERYSIRDVWVVVFSACTNDEAVRAAYDLGADAFLMKPGDYEGLTTVIQALDRFLAENRRDHRLLQGVPNLRVRPPLNRRLSARRIRGPAGLRERSLTVNGRRRDRFRGRSG